MPTGVLRTPERFRSATEPHERGACFVGAVFDAYLDRYQAAVADLLRLATSGAAGLSSGRLHPDLVARVTAEAIRTADRFLGMVVRAFDYLPPVDVTFGDVVRPSSPPTTRSTRPTELGLRGNLIEALRRRGIYPTRAISLTDAALIWPRPDGPLSLCDGNPPVPLEELVLEAIDEPRPGQHAGGKAGAGVQRPERLGQTACGGDRPRTDASRLILESVHVAYRQADDCQPRPEIVVQFTQRRADLEEIEQPHLPPDARTPLRAGTTLIARVDGEIQHIISKPLPLINPAVDDGIAVCRRVRQGPLWRRCGPSWARSPTPIRSRSGPTSLP